MRQCHGDSLLRNFPKKKRKKPNAIASSLSIVKEMEEFLAGFGLSLLMSRAKKEGENQASKGIDKTYVRRTGK